MPGLERPGRNRMKSSNHFNNYLIMKKVLIALAVILSVQVAGAQVKSAADAKKAVESAEAAAQNPKKAEKPATWIKVGQAYVDAYNSPYGNAWVGAGQQELALIMGGEKPSSTETVELMGEPYTKEIYAEKNFYFSRAGVLTMIEVTKPVFEFDALAKALDAYKKAYSVDVKHSKTKDVSAGIQNVAAKYLDAGMTQYMLGNFAGANKNFAAAAAASETEPLSVVDTTANYNAGFTAWMLEDYASAKGFFQKCVDVKYYEDGEVFAKLSDCYSKLGDKENAKNVLEEGFKAFPQSQSILIGLINFYIESGDDTDRLFSLLDEAKKNEPNNASLYYVEGNIHNQLGDTEEAIAAYEEANKVDPNYEYGFIGIGILYYNQALDLQTKAQEEMDDTKYMELVAQFETALKNAIEPFEKAYSISKTNEIKVNIAEYLKNIYYRFRDENADYKAGYDKYNEVVSTGNPL